MVAKHASDSAFICYRPRYFWCTV